MAEAVVAAASEVAEKEGMKKVTTVQIRVGELQQIEREIFEFALTELAKQRFKDAKFTIKTAKAELKCRACGAKWHFRKNEVSEEVREAIHFVPEIAHAHIKCPKCGSPDFEITAGRGVWLERVEGEK